jgi:hypothetical protein
LDVAGLEYAGKLDAALRQTLRSGTDNDLIHGLSGPIALRNQSVSEVRQDVAAAEKNGCCTVSGHGDASGFEGI